MRFPAALAVLCLITACKRPESATPPSPAQIQAAKEEIREAASALADCEIDLSDEKSPGKVALLTEDLRERKAELANVKVRHAAIVPPDEADKIANGIIEAAKRGVREANEFIEGLNKR